MKPWIKEMLLKNRDWEESVCSYLVDNRCSIYENRPACCRNFPDFEDTGLCEMLDYCALKENGAQMSPDQRREVCFECGAECCKKIFTPRASPFSGRQFTEWLGMSCEECREIEWCKIVPAELFK